MDISERIRELRKKQRLNQFELSEAIQVSVDSVRRWESNKRESNKQFPRADELSRLALVLGVTVDELLNGPSEDKVEIVLSWNWEDMKKGEINMEENKFKLILGSDGMVGLHGAGRITSREAIDEFLRRVRSELEVAFDAQVRRGVIQGN